MKLERLLFASTHGYLDPSNGAATARRDLLELLSARGVDCRVLSTGVLGYREETPLETVETVTLYISPYAFATYREIPRSVSKRRGGFAGLCGGLERW
ncbi:MAG: hypothetical protein ACP5XB_22685 [Isosphaeraceae bacterium]